MPFQNRVDPYSKLHADNSRGTWLGNRGILHNEEKKVTSPYKGKMWITCRLDLKGVKRPIFSQGSYSELFFLDEATAFSAGHRPCGECRRDRYNEFKSAWLGANPDLTSSSSPSIGEIDKCLHSQRVAPGFTKVTYAAALGSLPPGTFIELGGIPQLLWRGKLRPWSFSGYGAASSQPPDDRLVTVLTPVSFVRMFASGFQPQVHASAFC